MPLEDIKPLFFIDIEPFNAGILAFPPLLEAVPSEPEISEVARKCVDIPCRSVDPPSFELEPCTIACC